jgi:restriction system protein
MIPDYQMLMRPVLEAAAQGEIQVSDCSDVIADKFNMSDQERAALLPSGKQLILANRIHWAKFYLKEAGLVSFTRRGRFQITDRGKSVLQDPGTKIDNSFLNQFSEFREFRTRGKMGGEKSKAISEAITSTPEEVLREAYEGITTALASDLLDRLRTGSPAFFERTIVALLLAMGYGGSSEDAGRAIGQSGDDGVDGVIDQDPLGVDQIYIQAKRYAEGNSVGPSAIRDFFGSLSLKKAQKGIFVTTSGFSKSATETAKQIGARIVLIDAEHLGRLMVRHNVGCRDQDVLHIKRIDEDFFE